MSYRVVTTIIMSFPQGIGTIKKQHSKHWKWHRWWHSRPDTTTALDILNAFTRLLGHWRKRSFWKRNSRKGLLKVGWYKPNFSNSHRVTTKTVFVNKCWLSCRKWNKWKTRHKFWSEMSKYRSWRSCHNLFPALAWSTCVGQVNAGPGANRCIWTSFSLSHLPMASPSIFQCVKLHNPRL